MEPEKDPTDINSGIFNDPDINPNWCPAGEVPDGKDNATLQGELVDKDVFRDAYALDHSDPLSPEDEPVIIVSISHLWDATNCA